MAEQYANYASTTLAASCAAGDTTITVAATLGFPSSGNFRIVVAPPSSAPPYLGAEIMLVTAVSGTIWTVSRAAEALAGIQVASIHQLGDQVVCVFTAGSAQQLAGAGGVSSVFGRTGTVTAQSGDYTYSQVGADPSGAAATAQSNAETFAANASNVSSGVLGSSYGGAGSVSGILSANGSGVVSAVTVGTGLSYSGGTLTCTVTAPTGANPSASVGLTAVNGSATTFLRSDSAPALSQAIVPTWTGLHTFTGGVYVNESSTTALKVENSGGFTNLLVVDTTDGWVGIGTAPTGLLTVTGYQPASAAVAYGYLAAAGITFMGGPGGNNLTNSSNQTYKGGAGAGITFTAGTGGVNSGYNGLSQGRGGFGGPISFTTGQGGTQTLTGSTGNLGGVAGSGTFQGGQGGGAIGSTSGTNTGNLGGSWVFNGGQGGSAANSSGTNTAANGGTLTFTGGNGGNASGGTTANAGSGAFITFTPGSPGTASGATTNNAGSYGGVVFNLGGGNNSGVAGALTVYTGSTLLLEANGTGLGFYAATPVAQPATTAGHGATAGSSYTSNEQKMLQDCFAALESLGLMA